MDTKDFIVTIVAIVMVTGLLLVGYWAGEQNRLKEIQLTEACINVGFSGWNQDVGCFGGQNDFGE